MEIKPIDGKPNHYAAEVDGMKITIACRPGQDPAEVLRESMDIRLTYRDLRVQEYPPIVEQLDMIFHDIESWRTRIAEIKAKYPKQ